jgi:hypothetical protein
MLIFKRNEHFMIILIVIDNDLSLYTFFKFEKEIFDKLNKKFNFSNDGECNWFIRMNIQQRYDGIIID